MDLGLKEQVVLVTGASRGLGRAAAAGFAAEGARLAICARSEGIDSVAEDLRRQHGGQVLAVRADVTSPDQVEAAVASTLQAYGRLDILLINSGGPKPGPFLDLAPDDWQAAVRTVLMSAVYLCAAVIPPMLRQGSGSIVASQSYSVKQPIENLVLSNSVRMAVVGLMKSLAGELGGRGIRVNSIHPGWTETERVVHLFDDRAARAGTTPEAEAAAIAASVPLGRMAHVEEYARAAVWLASPAASYVHGHALLVDGGIVRTAL